MDADANTHVRALLRTRLEFYAEEAQYIEAFEQTPKGAEEHVLKFSIYPYPCSAYLLLSILQWSIVHHHEYDDDAMDSTLSAIGVILDFVRRPLKGVDRMILERRGRRHLKRLRQSDRESGKKLLDEYGQWPIADRAAICEWIRSVRSWDSIGPDRGNEFDGLLEMWEPLARGS